MRVIATQKGHFGGVIVEVGTEFDLQNRTEYSDKWMEWVEEPADSEPDQPSVPVDRPEAGPTSDDLVGQPLSAAEPAKPDPMAKARAAKAAKAAAAKQ